MQKTDQGVIGLYPEAETVAPGSTDPRQPFRGEWERIEGGLSSSQTWSNAMDGMIAVSWVEVDNRGAPEYCLSVVLADGQRCSGIEAFSVLADFDLLDAVQEPYAGKRARVFRLKPMEGGP